MIVGYKRGGGNHKSYGSAARIPTYSGFGLDRFHYTHISNLKKKCNTNVSCLYLSGFQYPHIHMATGILFITNCIKFTSCLPMVGGSLWEFRLLPPLKLVMI